MRKAWEKRNRNLRRPKSCWMNISAQPPSPSLSWGVPQQPSWKEERQPYCRTVEILRETAASYAHGTAEYCTPCSLHMMRSSFVSIKRRRPHMSSALYWRSFLLPWSYPGHFLPQKGHLLPSFFFTFAVTMTEVTPSWFVSILMLLKEAVLTNRRFLRDYSA